MTTTYTNINKPSGTSYTNQNSVGKEQYDQSTILYDDIGVFYDGINQNLYTNAPKPSGRRRILQGMITGLLIPLTYTNATEGVDNYTKVPKPT